MTEFIHRTAKGRMKISMKRLTKYTIAAFVATFLLMPSANAQTDLKKIGQTGLQFLKVDMHAKAAGMGGASIMTMNGADALFYNPAGAAEMETGLDFFASQVGWIADISYLATGVTKTMGNFGTVGVSLITANYGDILGTRVDAGSEDGYIETGNLGVNASAIGLSWARALTDKFRFGGTVKYASQQLGESLMPETNKTKTNQAGGFAYDFGTMFYPGYKSLKLGMSFTNFSEQFKYEEEAFELPLTFKLGVAMNLFDFIGGPSNSALNFEVNAIHPRDYTERVHLGGEFLYGNMLALRGGYKTNYDQESFSMGFGLKMSGFRVDYAYSAMGDFDGISRITVGASF
jgi:hypothetical protein